MKTVSIGDVSLRLGSTKIIVPITATTMDHALAQARRISESGADLAEWRIDRLITRPEIGEATRSIRHALGKKPLLATFRSAAEGGSTISEEDYLELVSKSARSGADALDVEYRLGCHLAAIESVHQAGLPVVASYHDCQATPDTETMIDLLSQLAQVADIAKLAVTPHCPSDAARLLTASAEASRQITKPIIAIAMGAFGVATRVVGGQFGVRATFAALDEASAPGQLPLTDAIRVRSILARQ